MTQVASLLATHLPDRGALAERRAEVDPDAEFASGRELGPSGFLTRVGT